MILDDLDDYRDPEEYERPPPRRWCPECYQIGGHAGGCPEAPEPIEEEE